MYERMLQDECRGFLELVSRIIINGWIRGETRE
jgi:hypothetical protein